MANKITTKFVAKTDSLNKDIDKTKEKMQKLKVKTDGVSSAFQHATGSTTKLKSAFGNFNKDLNRSNTNLSALARSVKGFANLGSFAVITNLLSRFGQIFAESISSAMDMIEVINLFEVSLSDATESTEDFVQQVHKASGLDVTNIRNAIGTYSLLARSMGMSTDQSSKLSKNMYQLALDVASVTNVPIQQALGDLRSGLIGQSETVYKYGIDVTEASLKQEALRQGITKSVRDMTQGEKMALRYNTMLYQTQLMQGDFAKTVQAPSNQLRILTERVASAGRAFGTMFIPLLGKVLPYLNALADVATRAFTALAKLFGYEEKTPQNSTSPIKGISDDAGDLEDNLGGASKNAEKLKANLMGFDELNVITSPTESPSGGGVGTGGGGVGEIDLSEYDSGLTKIQQRTEELARKIEAIFKRIAEVIEPTTKALKRLWNEGLQNVFGFIFSVGKSLFEDFIVPIGAWIFGDGLPRLIDSLNELMKNIDWEKIANGFSKLFKALVPFATGFLDGYVKTFEMLVDSGVLEKLVELLIPLLDVLTAVVDELGYEGGIVLFGIVAGLKALDGVKKAIPLLKILYTNLDLLKSVGKIALVVTVAVAGFKIGQSINEYLFGESEEAKLTVLESLKEIFSSFTDGSGLDAIDHMLKDFGDDVDLVITQVFADLGHKGDFGKADKNPLVTTFKYMFTGSNVNDIKKTITESGKDIGYALFDWKLYFSSLNSHVSSQFAQLVFSIANTIAKMRGKFTDFIALGGSMIDGITVGITNSYDSLKKQMEATAKKIIDWFGDIKDRFIDKGKEIVDGLVEGIKSNNDKSSNLFKKESFGDFNSIGKQLGTDLSSGFTSLKFPTFRIEFKTTGLNDLEKAISKAFGFSGFPVLKFYANGGFPDMGELFVANESGPEMVGKMGNRSAVANTSQIVEGIAIGVAEANREQNELLRKQNEILYALLQKDSGISEKGIYNAFKSQAMKQSRVTGKTVLV